jgi:hypothetical protein
VVVGGVIVIKALVQQQPGAHRLVGLVAVHRPLVEVRQAQCQGTGDDRGCGRPT